MFVPLPVLDGSSRRRTLSMLSLLLISLKGYRIISIDVVNKFQALLQICRVIILLDFTFLLNGLSHSLCLHQWIALFLCPLTGLIMTSSLTLELKIRYVTTLGTITVSNLLFLALWDRYEHRPTHTRPWYWCTVRCLECLTPIKIDFIKWSGFCLSDISVWNRAQE